MFCPQELVGIPLLRRLVCCPGLVVAWMAGSRRRSKQWRSLQQLRWRAENEERKKTSWFDGWCGMVIGRAGLGWDEKRGQLTRQHNASFNNHGGSRFFQWHCSHDDYGRYPSIYPPTTHISCSFYCLVAHGNPRFSKVLASIN